MKKNIYAKTTVYGIICYFAIMNPLAAQSNLSTIFSDLFSEILGDENGQGGRLASVPVFINGVTITNHAEHFIGASISANHELVPALNSIITGNVSFLLRSSTVSGVNFNFSSGEVVMVKESLGPIFAETGKTLGRNTLNVGLNYTHLGLSKFRGLPTNDMRFTFFHEAASGQGLGLGYFPTERDFMDIWLNLDIDASITALSMTYGVSEKWDIGFALPLININMSGEARTIISSYTFALTGLPNHHFGTLDNPRLLESIPYVSHAFGIGDLTFRTKHSFVQNKKLHVAALLDTRLPTGNQLNYMGTGKLTMRLLGILSKKIGDFTPHLNVGYDYRPTFLDSDEFKFALGFDQKLLSGLTFAFDILGEIDLNKDEIIVFSKGPIKILDESINNNGEIIAIERIIEQNNIPNLKDDIISASFGLRYTPSDNFFLLANMMLPLNEGGLRSRIVPTLGFSYRFK